MPEITDAPAVFKELTPAWNNQNLDHLARVTASACILAHVRAATLGLAVTRLNCHPFAHGPYAFMHNGDVAGFHEIRRTLRASLSDRSYELIEGSTDSEHAFAVFLDALDAVSDDAPTERMASALVETIRASLGREPRRARRDPVMVRRTAEGHRTEEGS